MGSTVNLTALATKRVFGGFIIELVSFANVAKYFPGPARLTYVYHGDRPYKRTLIQLCPQVDQAFDLQGHDLYAGLLSRHGVKSFGKPHKLPAAIRDMPAAVREALAGGLSSTDLLLTNKLRTAYFNLRPHARFRIPKALEPGLEAELTARGVDPNRFIVVFHCKEAGYHAREGRNPGIRNVDPLRYYEVMKHVIAAQGGQVVRIGDPSMTPLPEIRGLIDLSREADILMLQAYAISRARYAVCTDSGVLPLAAAFQTPMVAADITNAAALPCYPEHVVLTKTYVDAQGGGLRQAELYASGLLHRDDTLPAGFEVHDCAVDLLITAADQLYEMTGKVGGWRTPDDKPVHTPRADMFNVVSAKLPKVRADVNFL